MYVIFPLDELLDLKSAKENKRGRETLDTQSQARHTEKVLPLSQPNQKLPDQLKPPLSQQPKTPQPQQQQQQSQPTATKPPKTPTTPTTPPQPQQPQQPPQPSSQSQKPTLSKAPSKSSITANPPSIVEPPQSPVKKPPIQQTAQPQPQPQPQPPEQVNIRQRSSHSTSTETSSTSSTGGAKGKALLSPQPSGGAPTNRSSWGGAPVTPQESCPARTGSFKACKDLTVVNEGNSLKVVEPTSRAASTQDIRGSTLSVRPPLIKSNSFRSHLPDSYAVRPRQVSVEAIKRPQASPSPPVTTPTQPLPSVDIPRKPQESTAEQPHPQPHPPPPSEPKAAEAAIASKQEIPLQAVKEKQSPGVEGVKIKQEVPVQASPPVSPSHKQITTAESLRIQQECLPSQSESRALPPNQRHLSGRSNRSSGSQKLSDLPPSGSGGGSRGAGAGAGAGAAAGSANPNKNQGVLGSPRGLQQQQRNTVMASNEGYRDLTNPGVNESLKAHNAFTFKLVKTGSSSGALEESQSLDETPDHHRS